MHQFTYNISNVSNRLKFKKADAKRITQKLEKKIKKKIAPLRLVRKT